MIRFRIENGSAWVAAEESGLIIVRAGDADPGSQVRRRRREVALTVILSDAILGYLTLSLRLTYADLTITLHRVKI
jgi:hypothetical protein